MITEFEILASKKRITQRKDISEDNGMLRG